MPKLGVLGSLVWDEIHGRDPAAAPVEEWGGIAYALDEDGTFASRCNPSMVTLEPMLADAEQAKLEQELLAAGKGRMRHWNESDEALLKGLIEKHLRYTGSTVALRILDHWDTYRGKFVKVFRNEYKRALTELHARQTAAAARERAAA